jgi:uncharacterized protein (DUF169 family)
MISLLKRRFGSKCLGLKVNYNKDIAYSPIKPIRFCEAVNDAFKTPLLFDPQNLICIGGRRSLGLLLDDKELAQHISAESGIALQTAKRALNEIPKMNTPIHNVLMGIDENLEKEVQPDLYILYISPKEFMDLSRDYILKTNEFPIVKPFSFLSVCGNVFISTFKSANMSVSFGCPESRSYGGVKDNHVVVGLPYNRCVQLFS